MKIAQKLHKSILRAKLFAYTWVLVLKVFQISTIEFFNDFQHLAKFCKNEISAKNAFEKV